MSKIDEARKQIDLIDEEMLKLFIQRMECAKVIGKYKLDNNLPIYDPVREKHIIETKVKKLNNQELESYYINYIKSLMDISKRYQSSLFEGKKIAYSGVAGAFSHIACKKIIPEAKPHGYPDFERAYKAVENAKADYACLPIENSNAGDVGQVMDLVFNGSLYINKIYELEIDQCLLGLKDSKIEDITTVISHPQALSQCDEFIEKNGLKTLEFGNTALAAKQAIELNDKSLGVIASKETAALYGLSVLKEKINTSRNNTTRFALFSPTLRMPSKDVKVGEHFILVFTVKNEAGALAKMLNIIGAHSFNMRNLRSRPMKGLMWNYYFFVEIEGNINSEDGQNLLKELKPFCDMLKLVGTYNSDN
jgi:chorismate mutase/prephenate dehydratase